MVKTTVINIKDAPPGWRNNPSYVYIGRPGKGLSSEYGNEHVIGWCKLCSAVHIRGDAVKVHAAETRALFESSDVFRAKLGRLKSKYLICFCAPRLCHGDVYVELLEDNK